jgi:RecA/RadA recombinase
MAKKNYQKLYGDLNGIVKTSYDAFASENCIYTPSPSINWLFANKSHGIPKGSTCLLYSEPKAGKSLLINSIIAELQKSDPEAVAVYFNTELRGVFNQGSLVGVDRDRVITIDANKPEDIFDMFHNRIFPDIESGETPVKIVVIDSLNGIAGTKELNAESVSDHLIGDRAITIQKGLTKLVPDLRKHKINLFMVGQMRDNMNRIQGRGPEKKLSVPNAAKFTAEYFLKLRVLNDKDHQTDLEGKPYTDPNKKDLQGNPEETGHQIEIRLEESTLGISGRNAVITLDLKRGIINQHEELFHLGKNLGIIKGGAAGYYELYGERIHGKGEIARRIRESKELQEKLLTDIKAVG